MIYLPVHYNFKIKVDCEYLMIDECHSMGIIGKTGRGIEEHFNLSSNAVDLKMGTFSKFIPRYLSLCHEIIIMF